MKLFYDIAIRYIKSRIFGPKEYFERVKRRLVGSMIVPLFLLVGTPSLIVSVLSSFRYISFQGQGVLLQLVGEASNDVLVLATSVGVTFGFALFVNLLYGFRIRKTEEHLKSVEDRHKLDSAYEELKATYDTLSNSVEREKALILGSYICNAYPQHARLDPDFIKSLVNLGAQLDLPPDSPRRRMALPLLSRDENVAD